MLDFLRLIVGFFESVVSLFNGVIIFSVGAVNVSLWSLIFSGVFLLLIVSVFWKGARA